MHYEGDFEDFMACGDLSRGFVRLHCDRCGNDRLLGFACKTRMCPSCSARRMHQTTMFLVDHVLPNVPLRQWVLAPPFALVGILGARHDVLSHMCRIFSAAVFQWYRAQARASGIHDGRCGAVTFIQRFSSSLLLYPHLHVIVVDGVYTRESQEQSPRFVPGTAPHEADMCAVAERVAQRMARLLKRLGFVDETDERPEPTPLDRWYAGIHREPADLAVVGPSGNVAMRSQGIRAPSTGEAHGFSIHARVTTQKGDTAARERLVRYAARPPLADAQLSETQDGRIAVELRKPRSGQTHIVLEPVRLLRRLAWLIPQPRRHQIRFSGVLAPNARWRKEIVPAPKSSASATEPPCEDVGCASRPPNAAAISWAQLLRRTYDIDAELCERCGATMRPVAVILDPKVAQQILTHLALSSQPPRFASAREPP